MYSKVTIIGLGLMGGSLAKALRQRRLAKEIWALAKSQESRQRFERLGIVDRVTTDLGEAIKGAEIVVLCVAPSLILEYIRKMAPSVSPDTLVMDVGSSKEDIVKQARSVFSRGHFVGAHPMAGSEKTGAENAAADLYEKSLCFIVPLRKDAYWRKALIFWEGLGCETKTLSPVEHDRLVSLVSHLPHIVAFSMVHTVPETIRRYGAGGYKSVERLALSDPALWADIFLSNQKQVLKSIRMFQHVLTKIAGSIKRKQRSSLLRALQIQAKDCRDCRH